MESDEEESILEPEEDTDNPQDQEEYLNIRVMIVAPNHCPYLGDHPPKLLNMKVCLTTEEAKSL